MDEYRSQLQEIAIRIANGSGQLEIKDIVVIAYHLNFGDFNPEFLPKPELSDKSVKKSKYAGLNFVKALWGIDQDELVKLENTWLTEVKGSVGESDNDDKDVPTDLVTPQILTRVVSLAYFVHRLQTGELEMPVEESVYMVKEGVGAVNDFLVSPNRKGRLRKTMVTVNGKPINAYNFLVRNGVHAGAYSKFLPYPEVSLQYIFSLFHRDALRPEVYKK